MGKIYERIDDTLAAWLEEQPMFFVATAPLAADGHINVSPKGTRGTFRVLGEHSIAYLDLTGSGIETIAHVRENGRIVVMFAAFDGRPRIVRLWGSAAFVPLGADGFDELAAEFPAHPSARAVIRIEVTRIADSCGFGVPRMDLVAERDILEVSAVRKGSQELARYRQTRNVRSIDGLPGWPAEAPIT